MLAVKAKTGKVRHIVHSKDIRILADLLTEREKKAPPHQKAVRCSATRKHAFKTGSAYERRRRRGTKAVQRQRFRVYAITARGRLG